MEIIDTGTLQRRLEKEKIAVFDVRGDVKYEQGHIPGAMTAPLGSLVFRVARVMNPDSCVVVYSEGGQCTLAREAATRLEDLGMVNVLLYEEGLEGWRNHGLPVSPSANPKLHTQGEVIPCRPLQVNREEAYGGAFKGKPAADSGGAGG